MAESQSKQVAGEDSRNKEKDFLQELAGNTRAKLSVNILFIFDR